MWKTPLQMSGIGQGKTKYFEPFPESIPHLSPTNLLKMFHGPGTIVEGNSGSMSWLAGFSYRLLIANRNIVCWENCQNKKLCPLFQLEQCFPWVIVSSLSLNFIKSQVEVRLARITQDLYLLQEFSYEVQKSKTKTQAYIRNQSHMIQFEIECRCRILLAKPILWKN